MKDFKAQSDVRSSKKRDPIVFISSAFREQLLAPLKGAPLSIYLAYKSYANNEGIAWPSLRSVARATGYGINAVKRGKLILMEMGLLTPLEQSREGGQFGRKKFRVNAVAPIQAHGTVAPSTVAPSTVAPKQCQEGSPSKGFPEREGYPVEAEESATAFCEPDLEGGGSPLQTTPEEKTYESKPGAWEAIGIKDHGPPRYRDGWVKAYRQHREKTPSEKLSDVMEQFIRYCELEQVKVPHVFYMAKHAIEAAENRQNPIPAAAGADGKGKFDDIPVL